MKDFNIAKYLRENSLGSHAILGAYVDLHALKEEEVGNNKPVDEVPYVGAEEKLDGFGDTFDQVAPVEEAEMGENAWMEDVDGTDAYKVGNWTCYYDHPGLLVWSYGDTPLSELAVYATPNFDGDDTTPVQISMDGQNEDMMAIDKGIFADFNEYAKAMKPYFDMVERMISDQGSEAPVEEMDNSVTGDKGWQYDDDEDQSWMKDDRFADLGGDQIKSAIKSLMDDGFDSREIAQFVVDTIRSFKSFKEEVSVSSSGVEMEEAANDESFNVINALNSVAKKIKPTGAKLSFDDDSFSGGILVQVVTEDGDYDLQKAVYSEVKKLVQKDNPSFKVSRIEQDSPGRISFSIDYAA